MDVAVLGVVVEVDDVGRAPVAQGDEKALRDGLPLLAGEALAGGERERVVGNGDVERGAQPADVAELPRQLARRPARHVAADPLGPVLPVDVVEDAAEAAALDGLPDQLPSSSGSPISCRRSERRRLSISESALASSLDR